MEYITFLTYKEIFRKEADLSYLLNIIKKFPLLELIHWLSVFNLYINSNPTIENQIGIIKEFFESYKQEKIMKVINNNLEMRTFLNKAQILKILELSILYSPLEKKGTSLLKNNLNKLFTSLLVINDFLIKDETINKEDYKTFIPTLLPSYELTNSFKTLHIISRMYHINKYIIKKSNVFKDVVENFYKKNKIDLITFFSLLMGLIAYFSNESTKKNYKNIASFVEENTFFRNFEVENTIIKKFFSLLSINNKKLKEQLKQEDEKDIKSFITNFSFLNFRKYPLFFINERYYCLDLSFLIDKFFNEEFWVEKDREKVHSEWGRIFEEYLNNFFSYLIEEYNMNDVIFIPNPSKNKDEITDFLIRIDRNLLIIESKFSITKKEAKYSGDWLLLEKELNKKFEIKKGYGQLVKAIANLVNMEEIGSEENGRKIYMSDIETIYPILVVYEPYLSLDFIRKYFMERFDELLKIKIENVKIKPLSVLNIEEIENFERCFNLIPKVLDDYLITSPLKGSFINSIVKVCGEKVNDLTFIKNNFLELAGYVKERFKESKE